MEQPSVIRLNPRDNVAVALRKLAKGERISWGEGAATLPSDIPMGHKLAVEAISMGENIIKYGYPIGHATADAVPGEHMHTHNMKTNLDGALSYDYQPALDPVSYPREGLTFPGYPRANGDAGIRNDLFIVPTVGCVNKTAEQMVEAYERDHGSLRDSFDNVVVLKHPYGCSQLGDDHQNTRRILADAVHSPNAGAVLIVGLGCENNTMEAFLAQVGEVDPRRVRHLVAQEAGDEVAEGADLIARLVRDNGKQKRQPVPLSKLRVGLKCGGSDGLSGITANPLLGAFSDFLIAQGGSAVLTEVPEMFGAEQVLMARAENEAVFGDIVALINDFKAYFAGYGQPCYENPSPGNKDGGITTLEDKSLGCTQKSGTSAVVDVLRYGDRLRRQGLSLLQAPGNDLVASSALAAAGCQLVLFTTGRGTPFGSYVPTMKISTNTALWEKKPHWIDFNAGSLLEKPMEEVLRSFVDEILAVAGGKEVNNEKNGFSEIAIFKNGVTE